MTILYHAATFNTVHMVFHSASAAVVFFDGGEISICHDISLVDGNKRSLVFRMCHLMTPRYRSDCKCALVSSRVGFQTINLAITEVLSNFYWSLKENLME